MELFVIARVVNGQPIDYLREDGYRWIETPALAKWYSSTLEVQADYEKWMKTYPTVQVLPYDPIKTLLNPTAVDRTVLLQEHLEGLLRQQP